MAPRAPLLLASLLGTCLANFTNPFKDLVEGGKFEVTWDELPEESLPAYISGRVFNTTEDGVTSFQENISTNLLEPSFTWSDVPYPLPYINTAHYEIELIPQKSSNQSASSSTVKSPLFSISPLPSNPPPAGGNKPSGPSAPEAEQSSGSPGTRAIIIAVCVSLGIPILIATAVCIWWIRRHRRRAKYEESRRRRYETIID